MVVKTVLFARFMAHLRVVFRGKTETTSGVTLSGRYATIDSSIVIKKPAPKLLDVAKLFVKYTCAYLRI